MEIEIDLKKRYYIVELKATVAEQLRLRAREEGVSTRYLAGDLLERELLGKP